MILIRSLCTTALFGKPVAVNLILTMSTEGRKNGRSRITDLRQSDAELKATRLTNLTWGTTACLNLANCYLARGDILRGKNENYSPEYDEARFHIQKFFKWVECGVDKINEKCRMKADICWMGTKQLAIESTDELLFANNCQGETLPYSHNLCIGLTPGHWPADIEKDMKEYFPMHCSMACSLFRQYDGFHRRNNRTAFPPRWNEGMRLGVEDLDTRAIGRGIVSLFLLAGTIKGRNVELRQDVNVVTPPQSPEEICQFYKNCTIDDVKTPRIKGMEEDAKKCKENSTTSIQCLRDLVGVPWVVPVSVRFLSTRISDTILRSTTIVTAPSTCRYNSWVGNIYDDLPYSVVGVCLLENRISGSDVLDNRIGHYRIEKLDTRKMVSCGDSPNGIPSYIRGATMEYGVENGVEIIQAAQWHCSGRGGDVPIGRTDTGFNGVRRQATVLCPQEMIVCSLTTYLTEPLKITNLEFGCCDVPARMYLSAVSYIVQPQDADSLDYKRADDVDKTGYILRVKAFRWNPYNGEPHLTKLCDAGRFINQVGLQQWVSKDGEFHKESNTNILALDFKCTDYLNVAISQKSISEGLYGQLKSDNMIQIGSEKDSVDCGRKKYAFGIKAVVTIAEIESRLRYVNIQSIQFYCSDNYIDGVSKKSRSFTSKREAKDISSVDRDFKCDPGYALCGFNVHPTTLYITSGYIYRWICCPIPVRLIPTTKCGDTGVVYDISRNTVRERDCFFRPFGCTMGTVNAVINELAPVPAKFPESRYPTWGLRVRQALVESTNVKYGPSFFKYFYKNTRTGYIRRDRVENIRAALAAVTGTPIFANGFGEVDSVAKLALYISNVVDPDPVTLNVEVTYIVNRLKAIQDTLRQSELYTRVQNMNVSLEMEFLGIRRFRNSKPTYYFMTATCGIGKYNVLGNDLDYNIPSQYCSGFPDDGFRRIRGVNVLDNTDGITAKNFSVRFNQVGIVLNENEERDSLLHWLKWDDFVGGLFGNSAFGIGSINGIKFTDHGYLFERPNITKFYFSDFEVPAKMKAAAFQEFGLCGSWMVLTNNVTYRLTNRTTLIDFDWDKHSTRTGIVTLARSSDD